MVASPHPPAVHSLQPDSEQGRSPPIEPNDNHKSATVSYDEISSDTNAERTLTPSIGKTGSKSSTSTTIVELKTWPYLIEYDDLPKWYQDNPSILTSYRPVSMSIKICLESFKYVHNETVNIYTHLIPGLVLIFFQIAFSVWINQSYPNAQVGDYLAFASFLFSATMCFMFSASYHTFMCHSCAMDKFWLSLDFVGIIVLTEGIFASGIWFVFLCEPELRYIYWSMTSTLGAISILVLLNKRFQGLKWRTFRTSTFVVTAGSGVAPVIHGFIIFGGKKMMHRGIPFYVAEAILFLLGVFFYAKRIPEGLKRFKPGTFDIWGSSHQIFHVFVVLAVIVNLWGLVNVFQYNQQFRVICRSGHALGSQG